MHDKTTYLRCRLSQEPTASYIPEVEERFDVVHHVTSGQLRPESSTAALTELKLMRILLKRSAYLQSWFCLD